MPERASNGSKATQPSLTPHAGRKEGSVGVRAPAVARALPTLQKRRPSLGCRAGGSPSTALGPLCLICTKGLTCTAGWGAGAESLGEAGLPGHRRPSSWDPRRGWWEKPPVPFSLLVSAPPSVFRSPLSVCLSPRLAVSAPPPPHSLPLSCSLILLSTPSDRYRPPTGPLAPVQGTP